MEHFAKISGLQCNSDQTSVISIGGNFNIDDKLCPNLSLSWENSFILLETGRRWARYKLCLKGRITIAAFHKFNRLPQDNLSVKAHPWLNKDI